ncbi:MAG TPA: S-layer homology domain-containing protein, partial [Candidatus Baltobacteraceae bacterium]|nr:S-layer homology domain-containing protein [Candidatus Baltobacteraceae bacterium]
MKRLARLVLASGLALGVLCATNQAAKATPFADVPANHWAYQYIQSLAADGLIDGYPDGKFKGDRPLTRYEMAVIVARVVAKLQENIPRNYATKEDLDKLQKLIDALKDELDALGVRVTNLEDSLDALDKRTKFAQSLSMHGVFLPNVSLRQRYLNPTTITNSTPASVTTYYGVAVPAGKAGSVDPFVNAFISTDDSNNPLTQNGSGALIRQDSRFALIYQITDKLTVSLPVHIMNYEYGGEYTANKVDIEPSVEVNLAQVGAISNLDAKFGLIDNMPNSRTGLTFRAPYGFNAAVPYEIPIQPVQKGASFSGTIGEGAFGSTDFWASMTRVDQVLLNTQTGVTDPTVLNSGAVSYLFPYVPPQAGWQAAGAAGTVRTDTFNSGSGDLQQVFLTQGAVLGSAYVSYYNGTSYNSAGAIIGGPANPLPAITYNQAYNSIVFATPLPAGSVVSISYRAITVTQNTNFQRYMINARVNQKFKQASGLEIGVSFNRIYDFDDTQTTGTVTFVNAAATQGIGLVSDTVLGVDAQLSVPWNISGPGSAPVIFGEAATSKFTPDYRNVPAVGDTAGIAGLRFKLGQMQFSAQYQNVGPNFIDGAPTRYFGNVPTLFSFWKANYLPGFYGFGNSLSINQQFDAAFGKTPVPAPGVAGNPNLTFAYPLFNP